MWKLSGGKIHATDYTNASRTGKIRVYGKSRLVVYHVVKSIGFERVAIIRSAAALWDDELLAVYGIPKRMLPQVYPSSYEFGVCDKSVTGAQIPICKPLQDCSAYEDAAFQYVLRSAVLHTRRQRSYKSSLGYDKLLLRHTYAVPIRPAASRRRKTGGS